MISLFKKTKKETSVSQTEVLVKNIATNAVKATNEIIDEIHHTFYTEVDKLLEESKIFREISIDEKLKENGDFLSQIGFNNSKVCNEYFKQVREESQVNEENNNKKNLYDSINYFSIKYPQYKYITKESIKKICEKYGLVYSSVSDYVGDIPQKNIEDMKKFNIRDEDCCYTVRESRISMNGSIKFRQVSHSEYEKHWKSKHGTFQEAYHGSSHKISVMAMKTDWLIAANIKDFNLQNKKLIEFRLKTIEIPDPVVFQPVMHKGLVGYLIVTAWGQEATDELIVNNKMN